MLVTQLAAAADLPEIFLVSSLCYKILVVSKFLLTFTRKLRFCGNANAPSSRCGMRAPTPGTLPQDPAGRYFWPAQKYPKAGQGRCPCTPTIRGSPGAFRKTRCPEHCLFRGTRRREHHSRFTEQTEVRGQSLPCLKGGGPPQGGGGIPIPVIPSAAEGSQGMLTVRSSRRFAPQDDKAKGHRYNPYLVLMRSKISSMGSASSHKNRKVDTACTRSTGMPCRI